ncbi:MAG: methionyl-tRNA synthetase [Candidatus Berkelbacteria bacterium Licking1014_7]|uniref:Methionine--tRNA ligase n=1 Tax=Candidatus Berkelbacteria bacterium Licking1014_7 TaxID=2017147 RepID=A0A554LJM0_9BACT|nr:MAG: methionyl-tRNA synthetase [Candidatus Berkelbacteria bacterium Licking1014_7]
MKKNILITTSIAYANAKPHIGHAWELVLADVLARQLRQTNQVFFLTGTDENGQKIQDAAQKENIKTQDFVDQNSALFFALTKKLNISQDNFIRTSSAYHKKIAQEFWKLLEKSKDIYLKAYEGLYCVDCEAFVLKRDLQNGKCPYHKKAPEKIKEVNYFFRLEKYKDRIFKAIEKDEIRIYPQSRKNELLNLVKDAEDISFSRSSDKLPWGVSVPDGTDRKRKKEKEKIINSQLSIRNYQTIYVWCDALINYISGLGLKQENFSQITKKWQSFDRIIHFIGKDILRFHGLIWLGMLMSAGLRLPDEIRVHGFIQSIGQKMSKTLGNVIDPLEYIEKYGTDSVRFYLLKELSEFGDGDWSQKRFEEIYNGLLANELGNLIQRSIPLFAKLKIPETSSGQKSKIQIKNKKLSEIWDSVRYWNNFISQNRLWEKGKNIELQKLNNGIYEIAIELEPFLPQTNQEILRQLKTLKPVALFPRI